MTSLRRYTENDAEAWDKFVEDSKNGTFLFLRGYMDYHKDRFADHSLMFYDDKQRLIALLPANEKDKTLYSHQGLTYGGFILSTKTRVADVLELFDKTREYLKEEGFETWYYKQIPTCYHRCPAEEDEYALWLKGAELESCLVSTTIPLNGCTLYPETERRRKRGKSKAEEAGYVIKGGVEKGVIGGVEKGVIWGVKEGVEKGVIEGVKEGMEEEDFKSFWRIMEGNLMERYSVKPVHTLEEMLLLHSRLPEKIQLFLAIKDGQAQAGCVAYMANDTCVHIQYGHATPEGKQEGALDLLYLTLMEKFRKAGYKYMDFGNSNEQGGHYLNENLIAQKEGFGGRATTYKQWKICL